MHQGEKWRLKREAQERKAAEYKASQRKPRRKKPAAPDTRTADHVDGYDRDDLGESHD